MSAIKFGPKRWLVLWKDSKGRIGIHMDSVWRATGYVYNLKTTADYVAFTQNGLHLGTGRKYEVVETE